MAITDMKGDRLTLAEGEILLSDYVKAQKLQHPNKLYVHLDDPLRKVLASQSESSQEYLKWTEILERCVTTWCLT